MLVNRVYNTRFSLVSLYFYKISLIYLIIFRAILLINQLSLLEITIVIIIMVIIILVLIMEMREIHFIIN